MLAQARQQALIADYCAEENAASAVQFLNARGIVIHGPVSAPVVALMQDDVSSCQQDPTPLN